MQKSQNALPFQPSFGVYLFGHLFLQQQSLVSLNMLMLSNAYTMLLAMSVAVSRG
jgi:hypothetical protein